MNDDDITLQSYQDDLSTSGPDPFANSNGDDPAKEIGISSAHLREGLNEFDGENPTDDRLGEPDDMREQVEDQSEDENIDKNDR